MLLKREMIVSGEQLTDASSGFSEGQPAVYVKLDARGAAQMLETTRENLGRPMAVVFIEKKRVQEGSRAMACAPAPNAPKRRSSASRRSGACFGSNFQITGLHGERGT